MKFFVHVRHLKAVFFHYSCEAERSYFAVLLVFTTRIGVLVFSRFFLQEVDLFTRHFDLRAKVRKAVLVNRFSLSERSFFIMRCV